MVKKTKDNPHGLTAKQRLVIDDMVLKADRGRAITPVNSTKKFYDVANDNVARGITHKNLRNQDFREALMEGLSKRQILGDNSLVEEGLSEGLGAVDGKGNVDYNVRLKYIQEINKISGVYAPEKHETRKMNLNVSLSQEELDKKIKSLQKELDAV